MKEGKENSQDLLYLAETHYLSRVFGLPQELMVRMRSHPQFEDEILPQLKLMHSNFGSVITVADASNLSVRTPSASNRVRRAAEKVLSELPIGLIQEENFVEQTQLQDVVTSIETVKSDVNTEQSAETPSDSPSFETPVPDQTDLRVRRDRSQYPAPKPSILEKV